MVDMPEPETQPLTDSAAIAKLARDVALQFEEQGHPDAAFFAKTLPGYAVRLLRAGHDVDADVLKDACAQGTVFLKNMRSALPRKTEREETPIDAYERAMAKVNPYIDLDADAMLMMAIKLGHLDKAVQALDNGADVHQEEDLPIRNAAKFGHLDILKTLVSRGADYHVYSDAPLCIAAENGHLDIVKHMISLQCDVNADAGEALTYAAKNGHMDVAVELLAQGADIHASKDCALRYCISSKQYAMMDFLIARGADPTAKEGDALLRACQTEDLGLVQRLASTYSFKQKTVADCLSAAIDLKNDVIFDDLLMLYPVYEDVKYKLLKESVEKDYAHGADKILALGMQDTSSYKLFFLQALHNTSMPMINVFAKHGFTPSSFAYSDFDRKKKLPDILKKCCMQSLDVLRVLLDNGIGKPAPLHAAYAFAYQQHDIAEYLLQTPALCESRLNELGQTAIAHGDERLLKIVLDKGYDPAAESRRSLFHACAKNHPGMISHLLYLGVDIKKADETVINFALEKRAYLCLAALLDHGVRLDMFAETKQKELVQLAEKAKVWHEKAGHIPSRDLFENDPGYYDKKVFDAAREMLIHEGISPNDSQILDTYAYRACILFEKEKDISRYLSRWAKAGKQPLHNLLYGVYAPKKMEDCADFSTWRRAALECGPAMAKLMKFADRVDSPVKTDKGDWSIHQTRSACAQMAFNRAAENPALANLCMSFALDDDDFEAALKASSKPVPHKNIPDIAIDGADFGMPGARFYRLPAGDIRGLFLGEMTGCCQTVNNVGGPCAEHGYASADSGFYVVENAGRIIGQAWAWRGTKNEMCLDSLETLGNRLSAKTWERIIERLSDEISKDDACGISSLHVGLGGATPKQFNEKFKRDNASPKGYKGYRDSEKQVRVWKK